MTATTDTNRKDRKSAFNVMQVFSVRRPDSYSFLLDPSFLNSFLPLAKKPFFFLLCAEQSGCAGLSAGRGGEEEQQASTAGGVTAGPAAGPRDKSRSDMGLAVGGKSVWVSAGSPKGGPVWRRKPPSNVESPGSCSSVEDIQVPLRRKVRVSEWGHQIY